VVTNETEYIHFPGSLSTTAYGFVSLPIPDPHGDPNTILGEAW
jgi:hypothetical protein